MLQVSRVKANGPSKNKEGLIREPRPIYNGQKKAQAHEWVSPGP